MHGECAYFFSVLFGVLFVSFDEMGSEIKSCYIYSDDASQSAIYIADQTPVIVGRNVESKIIHPKCSRNQVRLYASYAHQSVFVQQLGPRPCGVNGYKTERGTKFIAKHGDCLEVLYGILPYRIEFNPPPSQNTSPQVTAKKRRSQFDSDSEDFETHTPRKRPKSKNAQEQSQTSTNVKKEDPCSDQEDTECLEMESDIEDSAKAVENTFEDGRTVNSMEESEDKDLPPKTATESWERLDALMIYTSAGVQSRKKIAAYDMDNTLIKTHSGTVFPKDHNDWQIWHPDVPGKLKKLHSKGYKIVIFTNQGAMFVGKVKPSDFKLKIERVVKRLGVPIQVFIAAGKDIYRKPRTGMWDKLLNDKNDGVPIDKSQSFFVGDAAGRPKDWAPGKKKDHSSADRLMAINLGLTFYTPEEHFLNQKPAQHVLPDFNPKAMSKNLPLCEPPNTKMTSTQREVIIMVGGQGTGKSFVAKTYLKDYHYVNRDKLGTWQKCVAATDNALSEGKSVVVDNTNGDVASRKKFVDVAKAHGVPVRCFVMKTEKKHAMHNNRFRELTDPSHMTVGDVIINTYFCTNSTLLWRSMRFVKLLLLMCLRLFAGTLFTNVQPYRQNYVAPKKDEGYAEIVHINFVPRFKDEKHRRLYEMYLLEK